VRSRDRRHDAAVRYLLGELTEKECDELEQAYFSRERGFEELRAIEDELIDSYVAGELSTAQRRRFESRFRAREQRDGIEFARVLKEALRDDATGPARPERRWRISWLPVAAALLVLAAAWLGFRAWGPREAARNLGNGPPRQIEAPHGAQQTLAESSPRVEGGRDGASGRSSREGVGPGSPAPGTAPSRAVSVTLAAGLVRDAGGMRRIVVPLDVERVLFTLVLEEGAAKSYQAVLQRVSGEDLLHRGPLDARGRGPGLSVVVPVPASVLAAGDYVLLLKSGDPAGRFDDQAEYAFRVIRGR
jgi:hypothetical protein